MTESTSHPDAAGGESTQVWKPDVDETRILSRSDIAEARSGSSPVQRVQPASAEAPSSFSSGPAGPEPHSWSPSPAASAPPEPGRSWSSTPDPSRPVNPDPSAAHPSGGYGAPAYSAEATSVYQPVTAEQPYAPTTGAQSYAPVGAPPYAPAAPPPAYGGGIPAVPVVVVPPPGAGPAPTGSRATAGWLSALLGLLLAAGGCYLLFRFGYEVSVLRANELQNANSTVVLRMVLAGVGVVLLFGAVLLNAWSAWATVLPGLVLLGAGVAAFLSPTIAVRMDTWSNWLFKQHETVTWNVVGATMTFGAILLATSLVAAIARAAGRRSAPVTR